MWRAFTDTAYPGPEDYPNYFFDAGLQQLGGERALILPAPATGQTAKVRILPGPNANNWCWPHSRKNYYPPALT